MRTNRVRRTRGLNKRAITWLAYVETGTETPVSGRIMSLDKKIILPAAVIVRDIVV